SHSTYLLLFYSSAPHRPLHSFPTRRSSDLVITKLEPTDVPVPRALAFCDDVSVNGAPFYVMEKVAGRIVRTDADFARLTPDDARSEEHTSELQSRSDLVCRLLLEKKNTKIT